MSDEMSADEGLRHRLTRQSEETVARLAQELMDNPVVTGALSRVFEAREKAVQAQDVAMGALNLPSAADLERLTRRVRQVSQRLEGIEDGIDRLDERLAAASAGGEAGTRLRGVEEQLAGLTHELAELRLQLAGAGAVPRDQERLRVGH